MGLIGETEHPLLKALSGGVSADIFLAQTARGPVCVKHTLPQLKVAAEWKASPARGEAEKKWIRLVAQFLPAAVPQILGEDSQAHVFAMGYLDPAHHHNWKNLLRDGDIAVSDAARLGEILGTIHRRTAGDPQVAAQFANDADFADLRLKPYIGATAEAHADVASILMALYARTAATRLALVHGDFSPKNILIGPSGPVILDAECAWYGDPAFDTAFLLNHLLLKCVWRPQYAPRYLQCARAFWQSYAGAGDPGGLMAPHTATLLPALMLARIDGKSPVEYLTAADQKDLVRRFAKQELLRPRQDVESLLSAWQEVTT
jgi:5-methylthioribose kinase